MLICMSRVPWLPKRLVNSLTRKLDIGSTMQDSCGVSESLPTHPMMDEASRQVQLDPREPLLQYHEGIPNANC